MRTFFVLLIASILLAGCFGGLPEDVGLDEVPELEPKYPEFYEGEYEWDRSGGQKELEDLEYEDGIDEIAEDAGWTN